MKLLFLPGSYTSPPARFRVWQFVEPLQSLGHQVDVRVIWPPRDWQPKTSNSLLGRFASILRILSALWLMRDAYRYDVVFINRDLIASHRISFLEEWLCRINHRCIFDFDDAIHLGARQKKLMRILPRFAWITPGNDYLAEFARQVNENVTIWPTVVNTAIYQPAGQRTPGPIRIGWSGSASTVKHCLPLLKNIMQRLANEHNFEFVVIADVNPNITWPNVNVRYIPWTPSSEVWGLQQLDIGLMPLQDEPFERGKCGLKAIQYMGVGVPALVSPVGVNREIVLHGETGFHCFSEDEWIANLVLLIRDQKLRKQMSKAARLRVEKKYSVECLLPQMDSLFQELMKTIK
jgi:glycosyltransferase involved in cell wall biosynthesis